MEFGEKIKRLREEKGMTQQTMADRLYVTRQAVSRWECGARFPDLLNAKKIAEILEVSIDELVSDEELRRDIEQEAVMDKPWERTVQTMLYTAAFCGWLLMLIFGIYSAIRSELPPAEMSGPYLAALIQNAAYTGIFGAGLYQSVTARLTPVRMGILMSSCYFVKLVTSEMICLSVRKNGMIYIGNCLFFLFWAAAAMIVFGYFWMKRNVSPIPVYLVAGLNTVGIAVRLFEYFPILTDIGFVSQTVHIMGGLAFIVLLVYQAGALDRKRKLVLK